MKAIQKILFPVDLSEVSPKMVPWILFVAKKFSAEIHLLFVVRKFDHFSALDVTQVSIENFEGEIIKGSETKIEEFANRYFEGYPFCKTKVMVGDAAEEIINYVKSENIDLVIIGTHGRKGLDRIVFGSVADRVIKMSPVPVLSINPYTLPKI
jgi:nucleotide-binding universal stress UspA family protein